jgi:crotonobetainyl-CoA:carnitine CoA-transferase CaiB-like acyl-CoA transferase
MVYGLLEDIRILDLTHWASGPYCTIILGALGADVIKVESIQRMDDNRLHGQSSHDTDPNWFEKGLSWNGLNLNKRGITVNLDSADGKRIFTDLVSKSDIVVENYSPRVMRQFGLDYASLAQANPSLIMISMSSFGQSGPWADFAGFASIFALLGGASAVTGYEGGPPFFHMYNAQDIVGGLTAAFAALVALQEREHSGKGEYIDLSQVECNAFLMTPELLAAQVDGFVRDRIGNRDPIRAPHNIYPCLGEDEWIALAVRTDEEWSALAVATGHPQLATDPRFATMQARKNHEREIDELVAAWTTKRLKDDAMHVLHTHGVPAGSVLKPPTELFENEHLVARDMFTSMSRTFVGPCYFSELPVRFSNARWRHRRPAPTLGQHNEEVLGGLLGLTPEELQSLQRDEVIGTRPLGL